MFFISLNVAFSSVFFYPFTILFQYAIHCAAILFTSGNLPSSLYVRVVLLCLDMPSTYLQKLECTFSNSVALSSSSVFICMVIGVFEKFFIIVILLSRLSSLTSTSSLDLQYLHSIIAFFSIPRIVIIPFILALVLFPMPWPWPYSRSAAVLPPNGSYGNYAGAACVVNRPKSPNGRDVTKREKIDVQNCCFWAEL